MQDLGPDMEDLLRKASESYPLKQGEDKWDDIASKISGNAASISKQKNGWQHKKYYTALLLLFFLLLEFLVVNHGEKQNNSTLQKAQKYAAQPTSTIINKNDEPQILQESSTQEKSLFLNKDQSTLANLSPADSKRTVSNNNTLTNSGIFDKIKLDPTNNIKLPGAENDSHEKLTLPKIDLVRETSLIPLSAKESFLNTNRLVPEQHNRVKQFVALPSNKDEKNRNTKIPKRGFYYGLVSGVHINAIKDQRFKKAGYDVGVLAGYRFSSVLSLGSGLSFAKKFYWTPGKYFSMDEMHSTMPAAMEMIEVHGSSGILELPLHLRYDWSIKDNHRFFSSAGFSSFIMTEENNQYHTLLNGTEGKMYSSYQKDRRYFAAAIELGLGYERDVGKKDHIRFEPYLQLPIRGIGVGHLPVRSAGLRIGLIRSVH